MRRPPMWSARIWMLKPRRTGRIRFSPLQRGSRPPVTGDNGVKMTGPYDYVAPSYWYVDTHNGGAIGFNTETSPGPAIPSLASRKKFLPDPEAWPPTANWSPPQRRRRVRESQGLRRGHGRCRMRSRTRLPTTSASRRPWSMTPSAPCMRRTARTSTRPPA